MPIAMGYTEWCRSLSYPTRKFKWAPDATVPRLKKMTLRTHTLKHARRSYPNSVLSLSEAGLRDIIEGIKNWRIWHLMGSAELRRRYARSRLGQFWLTLSTGILIGSLGLVWSVLWKMPVSEMMPYFAVSMVIWTMLTSFLGDATSVFTNGGRYFLNEHMSFSTAIDALLYQNVLIFLHNLVIVVLVFLGFRRSIGPEALLAIPGFCLAVVTGMWLCYVVAIVCTRYRDLGQVVTSLLQIAFFVTPVLWKVEFVPEPYRNLIALNPFVIYLSIIRDPLLGEPVPLATWAIAAAITVGGFLLSLPFIGRYRRRVVYWL
jgi:ABC-type polysaccharide/polyol phosphate export permease